MLVTDVEESSCHPLDRRPRSLSQWRQAGFSPARPGDERSWPLITNEQYLYFAGRALHGMTEIVAGLGDDLANRKPALTGTNSPYAVLNHCLGVVSYWAGSLVAGRPAQCDRASEFTASGPVGPLLTRARAAEAQLADDVAAAEPRLPLHGDPPTAFEDPDRHLDQGAALLHVYEELAQHHGQMQILADILLVEYGLPQRRR